MKTILFVLVTSLLLIGCAKKDYNCTCIVNGDEYKKTITKTTQSKANSQCSDYGKSIGQSNYYGNYTYKCSVK